MIDRLLSLLSPLERQIIPVQAEEQIAIAYLSSTSRLSLNLIHRVGIAKSRDMGSLTQRYVKRQESTGESAVTRCLRGFPFPFSSLRFQDVFLGVECLPNPALFIGAVILPEPIDLLPCDDGMVGDGSPNRPSTLVSRSMAEAILKDTVHYRLSESRRSSQSREDTAFYRSFPPDRRRELCHQD